MIEIPQSQVAAFRERLMAGNDTHMLVDIGAFIAWFAMIELQISSLLAKASEIKDFETFDHLCKGMDARVRVDRLRQILGQKRVGPNLDCRLLYFAEKCVKLRNLIAHASISKSHRKSETYLAGTLGSMPWSEHDIKSPLKTGQPREVAAGIILGWVSWLVDFHSDLSQAFQLGCVSGVFEITHPKSKAPPAKRQANCPCQSDPATPDTPDQTGPQTQ